MSADGDPSHEPPATTRPYEPAALGWLRYAGRWVEQTIAPTDAEKRRWWWERLFVPVPGPTHYLLSEEEILSLIHI